jgi:hypothetical protein
MKKSPEYPIEFFKEKVVMTIDSGTVFVEGIYYFRNITPEKKIAYVFYPFPVDSIYSYPTFIQIDDLPFTKTDTGVNFTLPIEPKSDRMFEVRYRQNLSRSQARYILTTLQKWHKPIEEAVFVVNVPAEWNDLSLSYPADSIRPNQARKNYFITRRNFKARQDLIISWQ